MRLPFRDHHLLQFLEGWRPTLKKSELKRSRPMDRAMYEYFRANHALGSKDREAIAIESYQLLRSQYTLDALHPEVPAPSWVDRLRWLRDGELEKRFSLPHAARLGLPDALFNLLCKTWALEKALELAVILQQPAPVFLRVNTLKISRENLLEKLPEAWGARRGAAPDSIVLRTRPSIFQSPWFREGLFEMQDEGSQQLAEFVQVSPGDLVLDYCAGSGGKSLAIATRLGGRGQLFLHDIRKKALLEARTRLKRAGIQNAQILSPDHPQLAKLKKHCGWVLVDAPCSGSGTLRRNPDMMERIDERFVQELTSMQRCIFEKALSFLAPKGHIVYATCSLFAEENEYQIEHFLKTYPLELVGPMHHIMPTPDGGDGFFAAVLQKKEKISKANSTSLEKQAFSN